MYSVSCPRHVLLVCVFRESVEAAELLNLLELQEPREKQSTMNVEYLRDRKRVYDIERNRGSEDRQLRYQSPLLGTFDPRRLRCLLASLTAATRLLSTALLPIF